MSEETKNDSRSEARPKITVNGVEFDADDVVDSRDFDSKLSHLAMPTNFDLLAVSDDRYEHDLVENFCLLEEQLVGALVKAIEERSAADAQLEFHVADILLPAFLDAADLLITAQIGMRKACTLLDPRGHPIAHNTKFASRRGTGEGSPHANILERIDHMEMRFRRFCGHGAREANAVRANIGNDAYAQQRGIRGALDAEQAAVWDKLSALAAKNMNAIARFLSNL